MDMVITEFDETGTAISHVLVVETKPAGIYWLLWVAIVVTVGMRFYVFI